MRSTVIQFKISLSHKSGVLLAVSISNPSQEYRHLLLLSEWHFPHIELVYTFRIFFCNSMADDQQLKTTTKKRGRPRKYATIEEKAAADVSRKRTKRQ